MKYFSIKPRVQKRSNKPNILLRALPEELIEIIQRERANEIQNGNVSFSESSVLKNADSNEKIHVKTVSFEVKKYDEGLHKEYCRYRELDMKLDTEIIEGTGSNPPSLAEINFRPDVIGSDETGKSEMFKPMVVAATYIENIDSLRKCIELGVYDSKEIGTKTNVIGRAVTGIESWEDELIQTAIKDRKVIVNDFSAIRIITNEELNEACRDTYKGQEVKIDGVEEHLLKKAHQEVLCALYEKHPGSVVVIDDFTDGRGIVGVKEDLENYGIPKDNIYLTTKGDAKVTAVGLASDISYYISDLGVDYAAKMLKNEYAAVSGTELLTGSPAAKTVKEFLGKIKDDRKEEFLDKFTKRYYANVKDVL